MGKLFILQVIYTRMTKIDWKEVADKADKFARLARAMVDNSGPVWLIGQSWVDLKESLEGE